MENKKEYSVKNLSLLIQRDGQIMRDYMQQIIYGV